MVRNIQTYKQTNKQTYKQTNKQTNKGKKNKKTNHITELNHKKDTLPVCLGYGFPTLYTNPLLALVAMSWGLYLGFVKEFVKELKQVSFSNNFMTSFDVTSLFTIIPLYETLDIAVTHVFKCNAHLKISPPDLKRLLLYATAQTHFLFNDNFYHQIDGVAIGSSISTSVG